MQEELRAEVARAIQKEDIESSLNNSLPSLTEADVSISLDRALPIDPWAFPHVSSKGALLASIANLEHLLNHHQILVRYDVIKKYLRIDIPGQSCSPDNSANVALARIQSLAAVQGMATNNLPAYLGVIGDKYQYNSVADWITNKPWDGIDRLSEFYATLVPEDEYPEDLKQILMYRWLLSAVAAALSPTGFRSRGVLTLVGRQSLGKTTWASALIPDEILRESVLKLDHHLDGNNKDSILTAVAHWIVEIGELDSSFRKDIARLKGFLTNDRDKLRRPYARSDSEYPRRTVFLATVNDPNFLVDSTGNSRWWTIAVKRINHQHGIDMQQLFAQLAIDFKNKARWWLTREEEEQLEQINNNHRAVSVIREKVLGALDLDRVPDSTAPALTSTQVLKQLGIDRPSNTQCKECCGVLREVLGPSKRIKGYETWRVRLKSSSEIQASEVFGSGFADHIPDSEF